MKISSLFLLVCLSFSISLANDVEKYRQIRVFVPDRTTLDKIWSSGIDYEGASGKIGGWMQFVAAEAELQQLADQGVSYEVVIDDLSAFYESRLTPGPVNALGFGYGSMGGFYTNAEVVLQLDSMYLQYPNLITPKTRIGGTQEGRTVWAAKISDNPNINEPEEPGVLYTALTHAREPQGMMAVMYYMWWLLQNYGTNPEATYLVNNRQTWFVPVVNVDGYVYNQTTNPNGGGNWRKNRKNNGGSYGVDLNRNYGPYYMWNAANGGSSTTPSSDTYRGPSPFSEPETQAIDTLMRGHNFKTALNYHTYSNLLVYPYGYLSRENPDSLIYRDWAYEMTAVNHYTSGTDLQTVAYATRGNSDDYMYGDTTKPITYTMTPEVGTTGFWPTTSEIFPLAIENLSANKLLAFYAGHYPTLRGFEIQDAGGNSFIDRNENFALVARVKNRGRSTVNNLNVTVTTNSPFINFQSPTTVVSAFQGLSELQLSFNGSTTPTATTGIPIQFYLTYSSADGFQKRDTMNLFLGTPTTIFADSARTGTGNWTTGSGWGITANAHTPPYAFTDSPTGNYLANANNSLTLNSQLNLTGYNYAQLKFWTKWAIEPTWDFATVEISTNNGSTWTTLRTQLSHSGSGRSTPQATNTWGYDGYTPGLTWIEQQVDLSAHVNRQIKLRFRMAADGADQRDGFYVDDIQLYGFTIGVPDTGLVVRPGQFAYSGAAGRIFRDTLKIYNFTPSAMQIAITETTSVAAEAGNVRLNPGLLNTNAIMSRLRNAFRKSGITPTSFTLKIGAETDNPDPEAFTTIITDERGESAFGAADIYRVQYQFRNVPVVGNFHDFRIVMANLPDTNVAGFISIDTDQEFGTGLFPTPFGAGPTSQDVGSEREVFFDASGILIDSLLGLGRIRAGVVISTATDTVIGSPFLLAITRDSVLSISTNGLSLGIREEWLGDPDRNMNVTVSASRIGSGGNPIPDFAPMIGHGTVGSETGVSWTSQDTTAFTVASGDSAKVRLTTLAAKPPGTYNATLRIKPSGRSAINVPITMVVTQTAQPHIVVVPSAFLDTLVLGDSTSHTLQISNTGSGQLMFGVLDTASAPWLSFSPAFGLVDSGQVTSVLVSVRTGGLQTDTTYRAQLVVTSNDPSSNAIPVSLTLRVTRPAAVREGEFIPTSFSLAQNYPNPFNPETMIRFDVPSKEFVTISVFNLLGQEVATLVSEELAAGRYSIRMETGEHKLSSGVYFYRLAAGRFSETRKMLLIR